MPPPPSSEIHQSQQPFSLSRIISHQHLRRCMDTVGGINLAAAPAARSRRYVLLSLPTDLLYVCPLVCPQMTADFDALNLNCVVLSEISLQ